MIFKGVPKALGGLRRKTEDGNVVGRGQTIAYIFQKQPTQNSGSTHQKVASKQHEAHCIKKRP